MGETRDDLREALALWLADELFDENVGPEHYRYADAIFAGPLAQVSALQAEVERLQKVEGERDAAQAEAYALKLAAAGGEDAPGSASMVTPEDILRWREEDRRREQAEIRAAETRGAEAMRLICDERVSGLRIIEQPSCLAWEAENTGIARCESAIRSAPLPRAYYGSARDAVAMALNPLTETKEGSDA